MYKDMASCDDDNTDDYNLISAEYTYATGTIPFAN
jgi:hypothetical protein